MDAVRIERATEFVAQEGGYMEAEDVKEMDVEDRAHPFQVEQFS